MLEEYLNLIKQDESQLNRVQSALASAMRIDVDDGLRSGFRAQILKRIQSEPNVTVTTGCLSGFFYRKNNLAAPCGNP
jgi:hypothetical protein